jgi:hypothetical protein
MTSDKLRNNFGAQNALKGYHHQFIYSLVRILACEESEHAFFPEGKYEDLDIYDANGRVIEIIQVKSLKRTLTFSDVLNSDKNSFIKRALSVHKEAGTPKIRLVSYGAVNKDIQQLADKVYPQDFIAKLTNLGLNEVEIEILKTSFELETVTEQSIYQKLRLKLEQQKLYPDIKITLDLLINWICDAARTKQMLNRKITVEQLLTIGQFQNERINFVKHFGSLIKPIINDEIDNDTRQKLKNDFYQGVSAKYSHVLADADVIREEKLKEIHSKSQKSDIIFIHGASGQGKSTLAYRYIYEYCANTTVFELRGIPNEMSSLYELINSLEGIAKGINFPITLYLDVNPGHKEWIKIIEELASKKVFKFIVAIRAEDWNAIEIGGKYKFEEVELLFDKDEANSIYQLLNRFSQDLQFTNFEEAWTNFGESGPLMEFVYLITQKESLPSKIKQQINRIRDNDNSLVKEKMEILRNVALCDFYGSEINIAKLASYLQIGKDAILRILELLEKEYLLKTLHGRLYIKGLHPIRSKIIVEILFDEELFKKSEYSLNAIEFISDSSIYNFYLNVFRKAKLSPNAFVKKIKNYSPNSWQAYYLILKSLIWSGIEDYLIVNNTVIEDVYQRFGSAWMMFVDIDFTSEVGISAKLQNSDIMPIENKNYAKMVNGRLTDKKTIFKYARLWLSNIKSIEIIPDSEVEWDSFALFCLWIEYLKFNSIRIDLAKFDFKESLTKLSLSVLSHLMYSITLLSSESKKIVALVEPIFLKRLRVKYQILYFEKDNALIDCRYIHNVVDPSSKDDITYDVHENVMQIIRLLRFAYPQIELFKTQGFGHQIEILPNNYDESIKEIRRERLPLPPFVELNTTFINLFNYNYRPDGWGDYVDSITKERYLYLEILRLFSQAIIKYYKTNEQSSFQLYLEKYTSDYEPKISDVYQKSPLLPKNITDEWGVVGEAQNQFVMQKSAGTINDEISRYVVSINRYRDYLEKFQSYRFHIQNFIKQSTLAIFYDSAGHMYPEKMDVSKTKELSVHNLFETFKFVLDFQFSFKQYFIKYFNEVSLSALEKEEVNYISALCSLYGDYVNIGHTPSLKTIREGGEKLRTIRISIETRIENSFRKLEHYYKIKINTYYQFENKSSYIICDCHVINDIFKILEKIYDCIYDVFAQPAEESLRRLVVGAFFSKFYVIPLLNGKTIDGKCYIFNDYNLCSNIFLKLQTFNLIPHEISLEVKEKYCIKSWNEEIEDTQKWQEVLGSASTLYHLAFHINQFKDIIADNAGQEIVFEYLQRVGRLFQEHLQKCIDFVSDLLQLFTDEKIPFTDDNDKLNFYYLLSCTFPLFHPNTKSLKESRSEYKLKVEEFEMWLPRLDELQNKIGAIYGYLVEKFTTI